MSGCLGYKEFFKTERLIPYSRSGKCKKDPLTKLQMFVKEKYPFLNNKFIFIMAIIAIYSVVIGALKLIWGFEHISEQFTNII